MAPIVSLTSVDKKEFNIFGYLRKLVPDANIDTLRQISVYMAISTDEHFDIASNCNLKVFDSSKDDECFMLSIKDGRKIFFAKNALSFGFLVINYDINNHMYMVSDVSLNVVGDLSTLTVYSEISTKDFGKYVVTFRPNNMCDETIKFGTINYYNNDEVNWVHDISGMNEIKKDFDIIAKNNQIYPFADKLFFDIPLEYFDTELDCYDGCLKNYLNRVDLLYNNLLVCINASTKKKIKKI